MGVETLGLTYLAPFDACRLFSSPEIETPRWKAMHERENKAVLYGAAVSVICASYGLLNGCASVLKTNLSRLINSGSLKIK